MFFRAFFDLGSFFFHEDVRDSDFSISGGALSTYIHPKRNLYDHLSGAATDNLSDTDLHLLAYFTCCDTDCNVRSYRQVEINKQVGQKGQISREFGKIWHGHHLFFHLVYKNLTIQRML